MPRPPAGRYFASADAAAYALLRTAVKPLSVAPLLSEQQSLLLLKYQAFLYLLTAFQHACRG
jgi:hypothetical protein